MTAHIPEAAEGGNFNPRPLTAGLHQRCDDSYFRVHYLDTDGDVVAGWYWDDTDPDGVWDGGWISGPFSSAEEAAQSGWEGIEYPEHGVSSAQGPAA